MRKLPSGWASAALEEIAKVEWGDTTITKKSYKPNGYPAYSASGQDGYLEFAEWEGSAVVLSAIGARCGKCFLADGKFTAIKNTIVIQANPNFIDHKLLYLYLNDEKKWSVSGSGQPFITMGAAKKILYSLPPISEQRRIVAKLEKLLAKVDACKERLEKIPAIFKRFRQSVLSAACSGSLTVDWREKNHTEPLARETIDRVQKAHSDAGGHKQGNAAAPTDDVHILQESDIPESWGIVELRDLCDPRRPITYGILKPGPDFRFIRLKRTL